jgi:hypothetical protein
MTARVRAGKEYDLLSILVNEGERPDQDAILVLP